MIDTVYTEKPLTSKQRKKLPDQKFGIPELRKYPLNNKDHVLQAIKMFNHVDKEHEAELAENILNTMDKYEISRDRIGKNNRLITYVTKTILEEVEYNCAREITYTLNTLQEVLDTITKYLDDIEDLYKMIPESINGNIEPFDEKMKKFNEDKLDEFNDDLDNRIPVYKTMMDQVTKHKTSMMVLMNAPKYKKLSAEYVDFEKSLHKFMKKVYNVHDHITKPEEIGRKLRIKRVILALTKIARISLYFHKSTKPVCDMLERKKSDD